MVVLQRSTKVDAPIEHVEQRWRDFARKTTLSSQVPPANNNGSDHGTVYFTHAQDGRTEITVQIDPVSLGLEDEAELNRRVDSYLERFKVFVEGPS